MTRENIFGASPEIPNANNILVEAYIPEFAAERTDVKMTAFITEAADARPARLNTSVNGLIVMSDALDPSRLGLVYGIRQAITRSKECKKAKFAKKLA